jgi:hypothetical protein
MAMSAVIVNLSNSGITDVSLSMSTGTVTLAPGTTISSLGCTKFTVTPGTNTQYTLSYKHNGTLFEFIGPWPPPPPNVPDINFLMWVDAQGHLHYYEQLT